MSYQSPISPGLSWYEASVDDRPVYPSLNGDTDCDVLIIGGGFTGLSAAAHLAGQCNVVLIEQARFGDGASGRNGGQLGTGQREWADDAEERVGFDKAKALFDLAEEAKRNLLAFSEQHHIDVDYRPGQMSVAHKRRYLHDYQSHAEAMADRFGYEHIHYMDSEEVFERTGAMGYSGGIYDSGTGHIHPLKLVIGTAKAAAQGGALLFETTEAKSLHRHSGRIVVTTAHGTINTERVLIATNGYGGDLEPVTARHIMPIRSFIGATVPLDDKSVLPGGEAVDDSRFVVRYFRKTKCGRLLFGGREAYTKDNPVDVSSLIRRQIAEHYPALKDIEITHAWGGSIGLTLLRRPFVREVMPGVTSIGGFSGHGVMLSNFTGRLYAEAAMGNRERLKQFEDMGIKPFPGGDKWRQPLLLAAMTWYSLLDRI